MRTLRKYRGNDVSDCFHDRGDGIPDCLPCRGKERADGIGHGLDHIFYRIPYRGDHRLYHVQHGCDDHLIELEPRHDQRLYHIQHRLEDIFYPFPQPATKIFFAQRKEKGCYPWKNS